MGRKMSISDVWNFCEWSPTDLTFIWTHIYKGRNHIFLCWWWNSRRTSSTRWDFLLIFPLQLNSNQKFPVYFRRSTMIISCPECYVKPVMFRVFFSVALFWNANLLFYQVTCSSLFCLEWLSCPDCLHLFYITSGECVYSLCFLCLVLCSHSKPCSCSCLCPVKSGFFWFFLNFQVSHL